MQTRLKYFTLAILSILCLNHSIVLAQSGDGGHPGEFLRYGVGARALGMGHAFTGLSDDAGTVYWNPAGLMNVPRKEVTTMYTNLFYDSRYTYMAVALPRTLVGPNNAVGLGWVNLGMSNFDQRDADNNELGSFDIYEQAFILSGAREFVSSWGILNYGGSIKLVNQAFAGLGESQGWGFGADIGATFRPINAPLFKLLPLEYIMPLQFGVSMQNVIPPQVGVGNGVKDKYPFIFRWGASYQVKAAKWRFNVLYDQEIFSGRETGHFMGAEAQLPFPVTQTVPRLRAGWNSRTKSLSFGGGLKLDYVDNAGIQLDFAYALKPHEALNNDFRLFLTVDFGKLYDAKYFAEIEELSDKKKMAAHLHVISKYPNEFVNESAEELAEIYDAKNSTRYYELIGGLRLADVYFKEAKNYLTLGKINAAEKSALLAEMEFGKALRDGRPFSDADYINYAEVLIIAGKESLASDTILPLVGAPSLRYHYLNGISFRNQQKWGEATAEFNKAVNIGGEDRQSMRALSILAMGEAQMAAGDNDSALQSFNNIVNNYYMILDADYPRYPIFLDDKDRNIHYIADDAQYRMAQCYEKLGEIEKALTAYLKVARIYPFSSKVLDANENVARLLNEQDLN